MKREKLLLVDGNNTLYRSYFKFKGKGFTNTEGFGTGCIYGFLKILHSNIFRFTPDYVVICFDQSRSKLRMEKLPAYKEHRKHIGMDFEQLDKQRRVLLRILRNLSIPYVKDTKYETEYEADDFIAHLYNQNRDKEVFILSSDEDFVQLVNYPNVKLINPSKDLVITKNNCKEVYGYTTEQAIDMKILCGDSSDNIKGLKGVGPVTALRFLAEHGSIQDYLNSTSKEKINRETLSKLYETNKFMIDLLYYLDKVELDRLPIHYGCNKLNTVSLNILFEKYSLKSFMTKEFITPFKNLKHYAE